MRNLGKFIELRDHDCPWNSCNECTRFKREIRRRFQRIVSDRENEEESKWYKSTQGVIEESIRIIGFELERRDLPLYQVWSMVKRRTHLEAFEKRYESAKIRHKRVHTFRTVSCEESDTDEECSDCELYDDLVDVTRNTRARVENLLNNILEEHPRIEE